MELIRNLLYGFQFLAEKITKKKRRSCAVILVGSVAVAAIAFTSNALGSGGKNAVYAAAEKDNPSQEEKEPEEEEALSGLGGIISGVLVTQNTNNTVGRIGTSYEAVLVGQRMATQTRESRIEVGEEVATSVEYLGDHSVDVVEDRMRMTDHDYETLLSIVEAEAGGEDMRGRILVANVIFNRVKDSRFPDTVTKVVWEKVAGKPQFSPTSDGRIHTVTVSDTTREAVNRAIDGEDYSKGALFFVAKEQAEKKNVEWFDKDLKKLFKYGVHDFYTYPDDETE